MRGHITGKKLLSIFGLVILLASASVSCGGGSPCPSTLTILSIAEGDVFVLKAHTNDWIEATVQMELKVGDTIKTGNVSGAEITFFDGSTIELEAGTQIEILSLAVVCSTGVTTITLLQTIGTTISRVTALLDPASSYKVETPSGAAAVRGSVMVVTVGEDGTTWITNVEGNIWAIAQGVELPVPQGQQCIIRPGQPPHLIMMIAAGDFHTVGLRSDGAVIAVGMNDDGQCNVAGWTDIINVAAGYYHTVGAKSNGTAVAVGFAESGQCNVGGWTNINQVAAGYYHTVGRKSDGSVVAVGANDDGQCNVGDWTGIIQVAAGDYHTVGLKADGTVVAVGDNYYGQCNVSGWTGIIQVAAGNYHTVGVKSNGTVVAVGMNDVGQCNVSGWTDIIQVAAGYYHTVGVKSDGTAVAAGPNLLGECDVNTWTGIIQAAAGEQHTVGLRADGTLVAAGDNAYEQCEVGTWDLN